MRINAASHLDHGLTEAHVAWLRSRFAESDAFFLETVALPEEFPALSCSLHGPVMGDAPVSNAECRNVARGGRAGTSRICDRPPRATRLVTVIAGPHEGEPCVLFTAFGGPSAPREPWDASLNDAERDEARAFWAVHALSAP